MFARTSITATASLLLVGTTVAIAYQTTPDYLTYYDDFNADVLGVPFGNINVLEAVKPPWRGSPLNVQSIDVVNTQDSSETKDILHIFPTQSSTEKGCSCGIAKSNRILGGEDVDIPQKYPWAVLVKLIESYTPKKKCAGSIISDRWILTAAHCLVTQNECFTKGGCKFPSKQCFLKKKSKKTFTQVTIGDHHLHTEDDDAYDLFKKIKVFREYIHPKFTDCIAKHYDFALLKLDETLKFNEHLMPVCLPADDMSTFGCETATVIGWGRDDPDSFTSSTTLQEYETRILNKPWCGLWNNQGDISPSQLCAGGEVSGEGVCHGDTGGPLMVKDDAGHYTLVGVASYVYENCGQKYWPDVYARVTEVTTWINQFTDNTTCYK